MKILERATTVKNLKCKANVGEREFFYIYKHELLILTILIKNEKSICRNRHRDRTSTAKKSEPHKERITLQIESLYLQQFMQKDDMIKSM